MARLEDLTRSATVKGILPDRLVTTVDVKWHGSTVVEVTYKDTSGRLGNELLYRDCEPTLSTAVSAWRNASAGRNSSSAGPRRTLSALAPREIQRPDYPIVALQQISRNAIMHRAYEGTNAPVRVHWYADRVEIQNAGGLYGKVNPKNFGRGATDYRNPLVAEIMVHLGFAQRFGLGVPLAKEALEKNGNPPPEFDFQPTHVGVTVRCAP